MPQHGNKLFSQLSRLPLSVEQFLHHRLGGPSGFSGFHKLAFVSPALLRPEDCQASEGSAPVRRPALHSTHEHGKVVAGCRFQIQRDFLEVALNIEQRCRMELVEDAGANARETL